MDRLRYNISRWDLFKFRQAAGLPLVTSCDSREQQLADEVFAHLHSGVLKEIPENQRDKQNADWSKACHDAINASLGTDAAKLANECKGSVAKSAAATKMLIDALPKAQQLNQPPSGTAQDASHGLNQVNMNGVGWNDQWKGNAQENERAKKLADRLKADERLKKIALLAGKFKRIVISKQKTRIRRGSDEISDIVQGDDIARLLPSELARIASPRYRLAAIRDLVERKCLEYEMTSVEKLGRGPLILCLDKSPSMDGDKDIWATAVALALLDMVHRQHRTFILLGFNDKVFYRIVVKPGMPMPEEALFVPLSGGTDIGKVLDLALNACETRTIMKRADIVLITDGGSSTQTAAKIRERAQAKDVQILGVGIGVTAESLAPWCNETHAIEKLDGIDDEGATKLFGMST